MWPLPARILADALAPVIAEWSSKRERRILRDGEPLSAEMLEFAAAIGIRDPEEIHIELCESVPLPASRQLVDFAIRLGIPFFRPAAMTLGMAISTTSDSPALLRHELVHVLQYQRLDGHLGFMRLYLEQCLRQGYREAPLEREAREVSAQRQAAS